MRLRWIALGIAAVALTARTAEAYSDEELGYSISIPGGYRAIPIATEEKYIVAKWQSEREYADKKEGYWGYRPEIKVILFDPKGRMSKNEKEIEEGVKLIRIENPYRTFKDWVKSDSSGGRFISKEEEITVGGIPTTWYEVAYEKLTTPRHGLAFVYHAQDVDYCVTVEVLEDQWKKLSPNLLAALRTFKVFPRKGSVKRESAGEEDPLVRHLGGSTGTPEERLKARLDNFEKRLMLAVDRLTPGWKVKRSKNYVALTHADAKFTEMILDQAEGIREWAEATFPYFGDGTAAPEIIRICKDYDEVSSFRDLSARSGGYSWGTEIVVARTEAFWGLGNVASEIFDRWQKDKNPRLNLPPWLQNGIGEWVRNAYVRGGKLEFRPDGDLIVALRNAAKTGQLISPRQMMQISSVDLYKSMESTWDSNVYRQSAGFLRYLLAGPGKSIALTKGLLPTYVENLIAYQEEHDKAERATSGEGSKAAETEEEEEAQFKKRATFWKDHEKDLLKAVFDKTFADFKESDWVALDKSYRSYSN